MDSPTNVTSSASLVSSMADCELANDDESIATAGQPETAPPEPLAMKPPATPTMAPPRPLTTVEPRATTSASGRSLRTNRKATAKYADTSALDAPKNLRKKGTRKSGASTTQPSGQRLPEPDGPDSMDEFGRYKSTGVDACDCLDNDCPGCYFPCPSCGSEKCGVFCRVNRKFAVEYERSEGVEGTFRNPNLPPK